MMHQSFSSPSPYGGGSGCSASDLGVSARPSINGRHTHVSPSYRKHHSMVANLSLSRSSKWSERPCHQQTSCTTEPLSPPLVSLLAVGLPPRFDPLPHSLFLQSVVLTFSSLCCLRGRLAATSHQPPCAGIIQGQPTTNASERSSVYGHPGTLGFSFISGVGSKWGSLVITFPE